MVEQVGREARADEHDLKFADEIAKRQQCTAAVSKCGAECVLRRRLPRLACRNRQLPCFTQFGETIAECRDGGRDQRKPDKRERTAVMADKKLPDRDHEELTERARRGAING